MPDNQAQIVNRPNSEPFSVVTTNVRMPQRQKQEQAIINLCTSLGITTIYKELDSQMNTYYQPVHSSFDFQSASNTILQLTEMLKIQ